MPPICKKNPVRSIRRKLLFLRLARIQMGQLSRRVSVNDINRFREMFSGTCFKFQILLMRGGIFSKLVRKLITTHGHSGVTVVPPFHHRIRMSRSIVSRQDSPFKRSVFYTFNSSMVIHCHEVRCLAVHPKLVATASFDHTAKVVDLSHNVVSILKGHKSGVLCVAIHPSGLLVATGCNDGFIKLWKLESGSWVCIATLSQHKDAITSLAFNQSLPLLVSSFNNKTASVWLLDAEMTSARRVTILTGHKHTVNAAAFHASLPIVATASDDGTAKIVLLSEDFSSFKELTTLTGHGNNVTSVAFHSVLPLLATGCHDGNAKIWLLSPDGTSATCIADLVEHRERILSVAFHPVLPLIATCGYDRVVKLWLITDDFSSVSCVANLIGNIGPITCVKFDGDHLLTCGSDGTVKAW